jgi:hypothetical protein
MHNVINIEKTITIITLGKKINNPQYILLFLCSCSFLEFLYNVIVGIGNYIRIQTCIVFCSY